MPRTTEIPTENTQNTDILQNFNPSIVERLIQNPSIIEKALAEKKLIEFHRLMWSQIDPQPYKHGWHLEAIAEHLEALYNRDIRRLLINIPPRHSKSMLSSVSFPAWVWLQDAKTQFMFLSYGYDMALKDSLKCRKLISSPLYQKNWGHLFVMTDTQDTKSKFINDKMGFRSCASIYGQITGDGCDILCVDDPNNAKDINSEVELSNAVDVFDGVLPTRLNNQSTGCMYVIQQRVTEKDVSGHILSKYQEDYTTLILPAEYEPSRVWINKYDPTINREEYIKGRVCVNELGWKDPRTQDGELLWKEHFDEKAIAHQKKSLGAYKYAAQFQQRPAPKDGGIIPVTQFRRYKYLPKEDEIKTISLSIDTAYSEKTTNDPSVIQVWYETKNRDMYLVDLIKKHMAYPELERTIKRTINKYSPHETLIEEKASGITLIQNLRTDFKYRRGLIPINPKGDSKIIRMENETSAIESGMVYIPEYADWLIDFEDECIAFPNGTHDDQVDAMSMYLKRRRMRNSHKTDDVKLESLTSLSIWGR